MNGYTHDPAVFERIANLIEQIPQGVRLAVVGECIPWNGDPHETERNLTSYCPRKAWQEQIDRSPFDKADYDILATARTVSPAAALLGPQEPPQDYRIWNKRQADGTFKPLSQFFDEAVEKAEKTS